MGRSTYSSGSGTGAAPKRPAGRPPSRLFGEGEDPLTWSIPLGRVGPVRTSMHVLTLCWVIAELVAWLPRDAVGLPHVLACVVSFLVIIDLRELSRVGLARLLGAEADRVVLWPLGGLCPTPAGAFGRPILAECGGLLAGVVFAPVLAGLVLWSGAGAEVLVFHPLSPRIEAAALTTPAQAWAWWAWFANTVILGVNLLLPMSSFDAGRIARAWERSRATRNPPSYSGGMTPAHPGVGAFRLGMLVGLAVFVVGACSSETRLLAIGVFGALATFLDYRRAEFVRRPEASEAVAAPPPAPQLRERAVHTPRLPSVDEVLDKVTKHGIGSLTPADKEVLRRETERHRQR